jgi:hypothetical protein
MRGTQHKNPWRHDKTVQRAPQRQTPKKSICLPHQTEPMGLTREDVEASS